MKYRFLISIILVTITLLAHSAEEPADVIEQPCSAMGSEADFCEPLVLMKSGDQFELTFMDAADLKVSDLPKGDQVYLQFSLTDKYGAFLDSGSIEAELNGVKTKLKVPRTALINHRVKKSDVGDLKLIVPEGYDVLVQYFVSKGDAYRKLPVSNAKNYPYPIESDFDYKNLMLAELRKEYKRNKGKLVGKIYKQLRSKAGSKAVPSIKAPKRKRSKRKRSKELDSIALYKKCRKVCLMVGSLHSSGKSIIASGVVISKNGLFITNYHVMNKPEGTWHAMLAMTAAGEVYTFKSVVAASKANDFAIVQLEGAKNIDYVDLADGEYPGTKVYMMAHPAQRMFTFHAGQITRYASYMNSGEIVHVANVSTRYSPGASGGGIFNTRGEVVALVAVADPVKNYWTNFFGPPSLVMRERLYLPANKRK